MENENSIAGGTTPGKKENVGLRSLFNISRRTPVAGTAASSNTSMTSEKEGPRPEKWTMGILNDKFTEEVPGTVLLLSADRNEPLGLQHQPARDSSSSLPSPYPNTRRDFRHSAAADKKKTADGQILLDPQPDDSLNDPLNWSALRRDTALLTLGFYCMIGGGMTPILAAGYNNVAKTFDISYEQVALTTGLYMMGLGVGSVIASPTAILFGKRPIYLCSAVMFILTSVWCAKAPNFTNLAVARVFQGISVSPVECLPSATIAEIFFLHQRAFRVGIYTLLLLGGKNLSPLVSAAIIQTKGWRWVFWQVRDTLTSYPF
jgi:Major Facilitator Superfamily